MLRTQSLSSRSSSMRIDATVPPLAASDRLRIRLPVKLTTSLTSRQAWPWRRRRASAIHSVARSNGSTS